MAADSHAATSDTAKTTDGLEDKSLDEGMTKNSSENAKTTPDSGAALSLSEPVKQIPSISRRLPRHAGIGSPRNAKHSDSNAKHLDPTNPDPSGNDVASLGSLEAELLGILWEIGRPASGMEVMETALYKARAQGNEPASFSTIATTLRRLTGKGLLKSQKTDGRTPVFWPTVDREQMAARILNNVSATLLGVSLHSLLPRLIGRTSPGRIQDRTNNEKRGTERAENQEHADDEEIARLLRALEETASRGVQAEPKQQTI